VSVLSLSTMAVLIVASHSVEIRSAPACPSADQIATQLRPLLPGGHSPSLTPDLALVDLIESRPDGNLEFQLRLLRPDGTTMGDRRLALQAGCQEMADALASVIAAWETDFLPTPVIEPNTNVGITSKLASPRFRLELGISAGAAFIGGTAAAGAVEAVAGSGSSRWQLRIAATGESSRMVKLDEGEVHWQHTMAGVGLLFRTLGNTWRFSADLGVIAGWATLIGRGYSANGEQRSFEYGGAAGLRVQRTLGGFGLWAEARTNLWSKHQRAVLTGSESRAELQNVEVTTSLGASVALFP
jgi:hypothetical protein